MSNRLVTRRSFLTKASTSAVALGAGALAARAARGANERLAIGLIGAGGRGQGALMPQIFALAERYNVTITAVCDVWKKNLDSAAAKVKEVLGTEPRTFTRFNDLLALDDVDAVMIATPDFAHTPIMIAALKAGKDVYCEKPMSLEIAAANEALDLARRHGRVVQVGTQNRSNGVYTAARDALATKVLGTVSRVSASRNFNQPRWARGFENCKASDVDWDAYLFNRPKRPFDAKLLRRWHLYKECTNGLSGLWGCHYVDAMHLMTGAKYPRSATALGGTYVWKDGREHCDVFHGLWDYPEGFLYDWSMSLTNAAGNHWRVHGTEGTLDADSGELGTPFWWLTPDGGAKESKVQKRKVEPLANRYATGDMVRDHVANWLDCLRTRERPEADIQFGHQHSVATIMAAAALHTGLRYVYDPQKRNIRPG